MRRLERAGEVIHAVVADERGDIMDAERGGREVFLGAGHLDAADDLRKAHAHVVLQHTGEIGLVIMERSRQRAQAHGTVVLLDILQIILIFR